MDMTPFLEKIDFSSVVVMILFIGGSLASLFVVAKGICLVLKMLTGLDTCNVEAVARVAGDPSKPRKPRKAAGVKTGSSGGGWC